MKIKMLDEKGGVSYWEISAILKGLAEFVNDQPLILHSSLTEDETAQFNRLTETMTRINNRLAEYAESVSERENDLFERIEKYYLSSYERIKQINEKIRGLPQVQEVKIPLYSLEKLIDIAEKCGNLTDKQWARVIELAKELKNEN